MTLSEKLLQDKLTVIAMNALIQEFANHFPLFLEGSISEQCSLAEVNRSFFYEKKALLRRILNQIELASPGRPTSPAPKEFFSLQRKEWELKTSVLQYRLDHPGAMVVHQHYQTYSHQFRRFILELRDSWDGSIGTFCRQVGIPYSSLNNFEKDDLPQTQESKEKQSKPDLPQNASETCLDIVYDYQRWEGSLRDFLSYEASQLKIAPNAIRRVLVIAGLLGMKAKSSHRNRGAIEKLSPGSMLVTDGKMVKIFLTHSQSHDSYNWQAMIDQNTVCHTACVISKTESAQAVKEAFLSTCQLIGRFPIALLHDNKPIHQQKELRATIEPTTLMIPATPFRPQNKADVEGEFRKFEQTVGTISLDDSSIENLKQSAVSETIRAYTAAANHAGRFEHRGKSRLQVLKDACPGGEKDRKFLQKLHANHQKKSEALPLPTQRINLQILDQAFEDHFLNVFDKECVTRRWLASRFTPQAIKQALVIFISELKKGRLQQNQDTASGALPYLVKVIQSQQYELDLREQEKWLLIYAEQQKQQWIVQFEEDYQNFEASFSNPIIQKEKFASQLAELVLYASIFLQRAFYEKKLKSFLRNQKHLLKKVRQHIRRLFEADANDRFQLISRLIEWEMGFV